MTASVPMASVVVRTRHSEATLRACLESLRRQSVVPEIIVVDSGSRDSTLAIGDELADVVTHLPADEFSYGRALNRGADLARADVHFALSSHCVAPRRWIEQSLAHYADPDVMATNGQATDPAGGPLTQPLRVTGATALPDPFWGFSNHASSWRAEIWRRQPFDEALEAAEDVEWADRVCAAGYAIVFDPALHVSPSHRQSQGTLALFRRVRKEARALKQIRGYCPPGLKETVADWWLDIPPGARPSRQRLSPYRIATLAGRFAAGR